MTFKKALSLAKHEIKCGNLKQIADIFDSRKDILVSIHCLVYNQEKYLRRCFDGFLKQKTNFNVEIIVHDDHSTDNSSLIIKEYSEKYPDIFKTIFQKENIYSQTGNFLGIEKFTTKQSRGLYVAICEGDDYWTDEYKLFLQVKLMEQFKDSHFCIHKVLVREENRDNDSYLPITRLKSGLIPSKKIIRISNNLYEFQTSSYFFRLADYRDFIFNLPEFAKMFPTDDEALIHYFGSLGEVLYLNRTMSCYNKFTINSWSSSHLSSKKEEKKQKYIRYVNAIRAYDSFFDYNFHKECLNVFLNFELKELLESNNYEAIRSNGTLRRFTLRKSFKLYLRILFGKKKS